MANYTSEMGEINCTFTSVQNENGLSKLQYTAIKIFGGMMADPNITGDFKSRKYAIEQAKFLLQEIEEESK